MQYDNDNALNHVLMIVIVEVDIVHVYVIMIVECHVLNEVIFSLFVSIVLIDLNSLRCYLSLFNSSGTWKYNIFK
jgi:hypothetical protein